MMDRFLEDERIESMTARKYLDAELRALRDLLLEMSDRVDEQFADAINALMTRDVELAEQVRMRDDVIDALELRVDHQCERILALHQPVAVDLRLIITAVKVNTDLERIGDHCKNIAKHTRHIVKVEGLLEAVHIQEMADEARGMLRQVHEAFIRQDRVLARKVLARDRHVDRLHDINFEALVQFGRNHPDALEAVAYLLTTSKGLERVSDHAKNIAESVIFLIEGLDVRHRKIRTDDREGASLSLPPQ